MVRPGSVTPNPTVVINASDGSQGDSVSDTAVVDRRSPAKEVIAAWRRGPDGGAATTWAPRGDKPARRRLTSHADPSDSPIKTRPGGIINLVWVEGSEGSGLRVA